jgi:hypothetical protein
VIDLYAYQDNHVLSTDEAREWLFPTLSVVGGRRKVISLGVKPLPVRGRQHRWLAGDLRRAMLGDAPMSREAVKEPTPTLQFRKAG